MDHILTLRAIIKEAHHCSTKFYYFFMDFCKDFDTVPWVSLFQRLRDIRISEILLISIMRLYESVTSRFRMPEGFSVPIVSIIGVKQGFPLSPTLFGIYIDELETFLRDSSLPAGSCYLHQDLISILLLKNDVILLASSSESLQRLLDGLTSFCELRELLVNLSKTSHLHFYF